MLDLHFVIENANLVQENARLKNVKCEVGQIISLSTKRNELIQKHENLVADLKRIEKALGPAMGLIAKGHTSATSPEVREAIERISGIQFVESPQNQIISLINRGVGAYRKKMGEWRKLAEGFKASLSSIDTQIQEELSRIPNMLDPETPPGQTAEDNPVVYEKGQKVYKHPTEDHLTYATEKGWLDMERGAKLCGSSFPLLRGDLARLERALMSFCLDNNRRKGYLEISPPLINNEATVYATGYLPKMADQMYHAEPEGFYLIPTAEAPLTGMHANEIIDSSSLPVRYTSCTPCWRREAAAGKDKKGLLRVHQFMKTEMFVLCRPEESEALHEQLRLDAEDILKQLKLHYRVIELCAGDMSFAASRCWDIECYAPGQGAWLEVSSVSNFRDFQTRRARIKYREEHGKKAKFCHTINGSGLAAPRVLVAIIEQFQNKKGEVIVPKVLRPYMGMQGSIFAGGGTALKSFIDLIVN